MFRSRKSKSWKLVSEYSINKQLEIASKGKQSRSLLDVGCGENKKTGYTSIDMNEKFRPDIVGDIRCCFSPDYTADYERYPNLDKLVPDFYSVIYLNHVIEHIAWKDIIPMFDWFHSLLAPLGVLYIATNNLEFIVRVYLNALRIQHKRGVVKFPAYEHPDLDQTEHADLQRWVNFKLFSGGSPGDDHFACFDAEFLADSLQRAKFGSVTIHDKATLLCIAHKTKAVHTSLEDAVWEATQ